MGLNGVVNSIDVDQLAESPKDIYDSIPVSGIEISPEKKVRLVTAAGSFCGELLYNGKKWIYEYPIGTIAKEFSGDPNNPLEIGHNLCESDHRLGLSFESEGTETFSSLGDSRFDIFSLQNGSIKLERHGEPTLFCCVKSLTEDFSQTLSHIRRPDIYEPYEGIQGSVLLGQVARFAYLGGKKPVVFGDCLQQDGKWIFIDPKNGTNVDLASYAVHIGRTVEEGYTEEANGVPYYGVRFSDCTEISRLHLVLFIGREADDTLPPGTTREMLTLKPSAKPYVEHVQFKDLSLNGTGVCIKSVEGHERDRGFAHDMKREITPELMEEMRYRMYCILVEELPEIFYDDGEKS